jgi:hypothetical protein
MRLFSRIMLVIVAGMGGLIALGGCQEVLFPSDVPRTQFEIYDRMRNQYAPPEEPDVFGRPQPALRERLSQK